MIDDEKAKEIIQIVSDYLIAVASNPEDTQAQYDTTVQAVKQAVNGVV